jgi:hypothetical protein
MFRSRSARRRRGDRRPPKSRLRNQSAVSPARLFDPEHAWVFVVLRRRCRPPRRPREQRRELVGRCRAPVAPTPGRAAAAVGRAMAAPAALIGTSPATNSNTGCVCTLPPEKRCGSSRCSHGMRRSISSISTSSGLSAKSRSSTPCSRGRRAAQAAPISRGRKASNSLHGAQRVAAQPARSRSAPRARTALLLQQGIVDLLVVRPAALVGDTEAGGRLAPRPIELRGALVGQDPADSYASSRRCVVRSAAWGRRRRGRTAVCRRSAWSAVCLWRRLSWIPIAWAWAHLASVTACNRDDNRFGPTWVEPESACAGRTGCIPNAWVLRGYSGGEPAYQTAFI